MFNLFKKKDQPQDRASKDTLTWEAGATQALDQALKQAPVPKMLKGTVKKQLKSAAEEVARKAGRDTVTAQDLMEGMLSKMPADMRAKVENAAKQGPGALKNLQKELGKKK